MKNKTNAVSSEEVSIISPGLTVEGKLHSNGNVRIDGTIIGDVSVAGSITVGENGVVEGGVSAESVTLGGKITGIINAKEKITLESKAVLKGDIFTRILVVEAGAIFDGKSTMNSSAQNTQLFNNQSANEK